eukprot:1419437-Rhodomonas_salina.1
MSLLLLQFLSLTRCTREYGAWTFTKPVKAPQCDTKWKLTETCKATLAFTVLASIQAVTWTALSVTVRGLDRRLSPQPKSQRDAHMRLDEDRWLKAEEIEMATCYDKGTFEIVDLPEGVSELPSMFQYKLKTGPNCETVKCKARLCARCDLQFESEYGETFAPT